MYWDVIMRQDVKDWSIDSFIQSEDRVLKIKLSMRVEVRIEDCSTLYTGNIFKKTIPSFDPHISIKG